MENNIKIIKLVNGDDIVCDLPIGAKQLHTSNKSISIVKPLLIKYVPQITVSGFKDYIALIRWTAYTNDVKITIPKDKIMTITNANSSMTQSYMGVVDEYNDIPMVDNNKQKPMIKFSSGENKKINEIFDEDYDDDEEGTIH
jgi:hypothetical protein|tara:strand:- start:70 stop:495 length:426 start_codon:yes stop_codon:yes gene_type:complete